MEILQFPLFSSHPEVIHGSFSRIGGVSAPPFDSLNIGMQTGDSLGCVLENREKVQQHLKVQEVVYVSQVHGIEIFHLSHPNQKPSSPADAIWTQQKGIALAISHADCQAALFYDPVQQVIGAVHAGWKGSCQNIYGLFIQELQEKAGTNPKNLLVCISPSLGPSFAEYKEFQTTFPASLWHFQTKPAYFDFWEMSRFQLEQGGIPPSQIHIAKICTHSDPKRFFSYRRDRVTGRMVSAIGLAAFR